MGRVKREEAKLSRKGWSEWKRAMVPSLPNKGRQHFEKRSPNHFGYWCVNMNRAFDKYNCGIYEWLVTRSRANKNDKRLPVVVYVGRTCRAERGAIEDRIKEYCRNGSHKSDLINEALQKDYELWVRVKSTDSLGGAQEENELLSKYDYAWNEENNGKSVARDVLTTKKHRFPRRKNS